VIEAGSNALADGNIDSYTVSYGNRGYEITVTAGNQTGTGYGMTEEDAFKDAQKNMGKGDSGSGSSGSTAKSSSSK
jgi:hypothetical protein